MSVGIAGVLEVETAVPNRLIGGDHGEQRHTIDALLLAPIDHG